MKYSTKIVKSKAKKIVGLKTVKKFDLANAVCNFSTFVKSLLVTPKSMTLAGLPRAGTKSKPHLYKQNVQKHMDLENMGFNERTV